MANEIIEDAKRFIRERNRLRYGIVGNDQAHITVTEMADFATGCLTDAHADLKAKCDAMTDALRRIRAITDGHGCGRYQVLCSACEAKRIATEAMESEQPMGD